MAHQPAPLRRPTIWKPILRAYILAYLTSATPRLLSLSLGVARGTLSARFAFAKFRALVRQHASLDRFPAACALLVASSTIAPRLVANFARRLMRSSRTLTLRGEYWIKFAAVFLSSCLGFAILNRRPSRPTDLHAGSLDQLSGSGENKFEDARSPHRTRRRRSSVQLGPSSNISIEKIPPLAGRTMDLTLFAFVHALGVLVRSQWTKYRERQARPSDAVLSLAGLASPVIFVLSCHIIMFNWFYSPDRLPGNYRNWISSAAQIDKRLIEALRQCRYGSFIYGKDTGLGPLLRNMCRDLGYPEVWGDPAITVPIPCELYHSGTGPSCEWHAIRRFIRGWTFAMKMNLPLNLLILSRREPAKRSFTQAFIDASRSSAFLGGFIAAFYYGVCLARTRIGPNLFSRKTISPQMWDGGLCVDTGCLACGWSIMFEKPARRQEIAFFVAPRALATVCPRRYPREYMWREQLAFAFSAATILVAAQDNPAQIQGVFGRLLSQIYK